MALEAQKNSGSRALLVAVNKENLEIGIKQVHKHGRTVFGSRVESPFVACPKGTPVYIYVAHTKEDKGQVGYKGSLGEVWIPETTPDLHDPQEWRSFTSTFEEHFGFRFEEVKTGAEQEWEESIWPSFYGVQNLRKLQEAHNVSEFRSWRTGNYYNPKWTVRRPVVVVDPFMSVLATETSLQRPQNYKGRLYPDVTERHWNYLKALASCGKSQVKWNPDWKEAYKQLTALDTKLPPGTMTAGVFEARGWVEKTGKRSPFQYRITPQGRAAVAQNLIQDTYDQAEDQKALLMEEAERLDSAPSVSKEQAKLVLTRFSASMPKASIKNVRRYERSAIGQALKALYNGHCQICGFTFPKRDGTNYAEVHHLEALSEGGWEAPRNMLVVCANCHRQLHYGRVERIGWDIDQLVLRINGEISRIRFQPSHLSA